MKSEKKLMKPFFQPTDRMADLILSCHRLISVLPRFGIQFGFADRSVSEVCAQYGADTTLFLEICNMYASPDYCPSVAVPSPAYIRGLLTYLESSHRYYRDERLPHIADHLLHLSASLENLEREMIQHFFNQYREEADKHFSYEEQHVFPYVEQLASGQTAAYRIHDFEESHGDIEETLADLISLIIKYLPGDTLPRERASILFDLFNLSADLAAHTRIESKLLVGIARAMEKSLKP